MNLKLIMLILCVFSFDKIYAAYDVDAKKIISDYAAEKKVPIVVSEDSIELFLNKGQDWKWIELGGVIVGYPKAELPFRLSRAINKNVDIYLSLREKVVDDNIKLTGYKAPVADLLKYFSATCGVKIKSPANVHGNMFFLTDAKVPVSTVCQTLVYAFTLNGISFQVDRGTHSITAIQEN